jgi:hypothetical protein
MTNDSVEAKALALVNEVREERNYPLQAKIYRVVDADIEALCRAIEQHEAFKQEVSNALYDYFGDADSTGGDTLNRFFIPKPDPLVEVIEKCAAQMHLTSEDAAKELRAALDAVGFEIREKGQ